MERPLSNQAILLVTLLGLALIFSGIDFFYARKSTTTLPVKYHAIGVVDMSADNIISTKTLSTGEDAALVLDDNWKGKITTDLAYYDKNVDGFVTLDDPVYPYLELFFLRTGKAYPISVAGIRAIRLKSKYTKIDYDAIFSDDSVRIIRTK